LVITFAIDYSTIAYFLIKCKDYLAEKQIL